METLSLTPLDIGFDPRLHPDLVVNVPADTRSVTYDLSGQTCTVSGSLAEIKRALRAAGYRIRISHRVSP